MQTVTGCVPGSAREKRELSFFREFLRCLEDAYGFRMIRPYPTTVRELQVDYPEYGATILRCLAGVTTLAECWEKCPPFRPLLSWVQRTGWTPSTVRAALQLAEMYKKVSEVCEDVYVERAVETFHEDENSLWTPSEGDTPLLECAAKLIQKWIGPAPRVVKLEDLKPGPGATASREDHVARYNHMPSFDVQEHVEDLSEMLRYMTCYELEPSTARMMAVAKTATKPRLISAEPHWNLMFQQALHSQLSRRMNRHAYLNISSQDRNGWLCRRDDVATIDQSRASDRVSLAHVVELFPPAWTEVLLAGRTPCVTCLCGENHTLRKFAGMGSATTFPVETLVFAAVAVAAIILDDELGDGLEEVDIDRIGFYGDDAIVPLEHANTVLDAYARLGFLPNYEKSYWTGHFRESCGVYSFMGVDVTPARRSRWLPNTGRDVEEVVALIEFINRAEYLYSGTEGLRPYLPVHNVQAVPYIVNTQGPKASLIREAAGVGWFEYNKMGSLESHRALTVVPSRRHAPKEYDGEVLLAICLLELEQRDLLGPESERSLGERFYPRPVSLKLRNRRVSA